jgi:hypothetical protein
MVAKHECIRRVLPSFGSPALLVPQPIPTPVFSQSSHGHGQFTVTYPASAPDRLTPRWSANNRLTTERSLSCRRSAPDRRSHRSPTGLCYDLPILLRERLTCGEIHCTCPPASQVWVPTCAKTRRLGHHMAKQQLERQTIVLAALLHDIGKFAQRAGVPSTRSTRRWTGPITEPTARTRCRRFSSWSKSSGQTSLTAGRRFSTITARRSGQATLRRRG